MESPHILAFVRGDGIFKNTNPAWFRILGRTAEDVENRPFFDFVHPDDIERTAQAFTDAQAGGIVRDFENRYRHKDGSYRWLRWSGAPEGEDYFCQGIDITEHKLIEENLARIEAELLVRDQLLEIINHDLRRPLATVSSVLRSMEMQKADGAAFARPARVALSEVTRVLDDAEDFANASLGGTMGGIVIDPDARLRQALDRVIETFSDIYSFAKVSLTFAANDPIPCDTHRIGQLVNKLLINAILYGAADEPINVSVEDHGATVEIVVTNSGGRMTEDTVARLFRPFQRRKNAGDRSGIGLGLYLSTLIAEAHGGSLSVAVNDDERTSFKLVLPRH